MHPVGPITEHIKLSSGGDTYALKHYCTSNENSYGAGWEHFTPRIGSHSGAGFVSNNRGHLSYTSHLDEIDNAKMGEIIKTNYKSINHRDFVGYKIPSGRENLPSVFLDTSIHVPTQLHVQDQFINRLLNKSPSKSPSKGKPLLHQIGPKYPIMLENDGHGPKYMSTEYKTNYDGKQSKDLGPGVIGNCEMTGFTENNKTEETLEGRPDACHCNHDLCGSHLNSRPTGISIYNTHFLPLGIPNGREPLPNIDLRAAVSNGFTKCNKVVPDFVEIHPTRVYDRAEDMTDVKLEWIKKNDPAEYTNAIYCSKIPTMVNAMYQGKQIHPAENSDFRTQIGQREISGYTSNEDSYTQTRDDPHRFISHSSTQFYDPSLVGDERNGHVNGQVQSIKETGFSREVKLHQIEPQPDALHIHSRFTPYQSRVIVARETITTSPTKCAIQA